MVRRPKAITETQKKAITRLASSFFIARGRRASGLPLGQAQDYPRLFCSGTYAETFALHAAPAGTRRSAPGCRSVLEVKRIMLASGRRIRSACIRPALL